MTIPERPPPFAPTSQPDLSATNNSGSGGTGSFDLGLLVEQHESDEAMARRLQAEEDEFHHHQDQYSPSNANTNTNTSTSTSNINNNNHNRSGRSLMQETAVSRSSSARTGMSNTSRNSNSNASNRSVARSNNPHRSRSRSRTRSTTIPYPQSSTPTPQPSSAFSFNLSSSQQQQQESKRKQREHEDRMLALSMQQELQDAELARTMQVKEGQSMRVVRNGNLRQTVPGPVRASGESGYGPPPRRCCGGKRLCSAGVMLMVIGGGAFLIANYGSSIWKKLGGNPDDLPPFFHDDWGSGGGSGSGGNATQGEFSEWKTSNKGLELKIRNALTSDWDPYFEEAVKDWNMAPALQLSTDDVDADPSCKEVRGILKVCNKDFGQTGWTGLNEVYYEGKWIVKSVAKMNEYYLSTSQTTNAEKLFVMCHEIGHGFGLPHRDEIANNADLGSCMDYTYRFENNKRPDALIDFDNLENLYGRIDGKRSMLRVSKSRNELQSDRLPEEIEEVEHGSKRMLYREGQLLHQSKFREVYENHIGDDERVVTTILLARSFDDVAD